MAESNEKSTKTLKIGRPNKLSLTKTIDGGKVKQSFSHGRSKTVTVEVRKTRNFARKAGGRMEEVDSSSKSEDIKAKLEALKPQASTQVREKTKLQDVSVPTSAKSKKDVVLGKAELAKMSADMEPSKSGEDRVTQDQQQDATTSSSITSDDTSSLTTAMKPETAGASAATATGESEAIDGLADDGDGAASSSGGAEQLAPCINTIRSRKKIQSLDSIATKSSTSKKDGVVVAPKKEPDISPSVAVPPISSDIKGEAPSKKHSGKSSALSEERGKTKKIKLKSIGGTGRRQSNKLTISQALEERGERVRSLASLKRRREKIKRLESGGVTEVKEKVTREVVVPETITVQELANRMAERSTDVIRALMKLGTMATAAQAIDADTAELIIEEFGHKIKRVTEADVEDILVDEPDDEKDLEPRAPVVTVMGHVDHGKTSLLDALREADVVAGEAGGITQHIGAYQVRAGKTGEKVTFLDTPGHEAFTAMRSRGAKVTDIVVLVVAADDGIKAQTEEAISHAKAADVPIIVAINKIDKPEANPDRVRNELMQHELVPEELGGDVQTVEVSAKTKEGLDDLVDSILLQAEILELKANPNRRAAGVVVESKLDKARGAVATLLLQKGSLRIGDIVVAGTAWGRVRALLNDHGKNIKKAKPSQPVEVLGLNEAPMAGETFSVVQDEKTAREITEYRIRKAKEKQNIVKAKSLDQLFAEAQAGEHKELLLVIKGDVQGSVEAIVGSVSKFNSDEVSVKVLHTGVGGINESDVSLAQATGAIIIGFNVRATAGARSQAEQEGVDIRYYSVIYDLIDDVKDALSGMLSPDLREKFLGNAEIREVFNISKVGKVAGCMVIEGMVKRGAKVRLLRDNVVIHEGTLKTLKRHKDEVKEVKSGYECGMAFENYDDIREGDIIEAFEIEEIARTVDDKR